MKRALSIGVMALSLVGLSARNSQAALINFDDVASGTLINTQYSALGVTFGCFNGTQDPNDLCTGDAYAVSSPSAASGPNVISFTSGVPLGVFADERFGYFRASFSTAVSSVSIDAKAVNPPEFLGGTTNRPFLQAFNSSNQLIGQAVYAGNTDLEGWETLTINTSGIAYVAFSSYSSSGHAVYGEFDNLNFSGGSTGGGGGDPSVPEPTSLAMMSIGLAIAAARRKAKSA